MSLEDGFDCAYCYDNAEASAWGPKLPGLLSIMGSYTIIRELLADNNVFCCRRFATAITTAGSSSEQAASRQRRGRNRGPPQRQRGKTVDRLLLALSLADLCFSLPYIFTTWAAPAFLDDLYQSSGTVQTCTLQGFLLQLGVSTSPLFSTALPVCALLMVRYNWSITKLERLEKWIYGVVWTYGLAASVPFIFLKGYNPTSTSCWLTAYPRGCVFTDLYACERGDERTLLMSTIFAFFPTWPCILVGIISMIGIYVTVYSVENRNSRYAGQSMVASTAGQPNHSIIGNNHDGNNNSNQQKRNALQEHLNKHVTANNKLNNKPPESAKFGRRGEKARNSITSIASTTTAANRNRSTAVAHQAALYSMFSILTYSLDTITIAIGYSTGAHYPNLTVAAYILFPLQGFFNFCIFVRPRREMKTPEGRFLRKLVCCGCWTIPSTSRNNRNNKNHAEIEIATIHEHRPDMDASNKQQPVIQFNQYSDSSSEHHDVAGVECADGAFAYQNPYHGNAMSDDNDGVSTDSTENPFGNNEISYSGQQPCDFHQRTTDGKNDKHDAEFSCEEARHSHVEFQEMDGDHASQHEDTQQRLQNHQLVDSTAPSATATASMTPTALALDSRNQSSIKSDVYRRESGLPSQHFRVDPTGTIISTDNSSSFAAPS